MAVPQAINTNSGRTSSPVRVYYTPPPDRPPNAFAAFWHAYHETRNEWAQKVFDKRLAMYDPQTQYRMLGELQQRRALLVQQRAEFERALSSDAAQAAQGRDASNQEAMRFYGDIVKAYASIRSAELGVESSAVSGAWGFKAAAAKLEADAAANAVMDPKFQPEVTNVMQDLASRGANVPAAKIQMQSFIARTVAKADSDDAFAIAAEVRKRASNLPADVRSAVLQELEPYLRGPVTVTGDASLGGAPPPMGPSQGTSIGSLMSQLGLDPVALGLGGAPGGPGAASGGAGTAVPASPPTPSVDADGVRRAFDELEGQIDEDDRNLRYLLEQVYPNLGGVFDPLPFDQRRPDFLPAAGPAFVPDIRSRTMGALNLRAADPWGGGRAKAPPEDDAPPAEDEAEAPEKAPPARKPQATAAAPSIPKDAQRKDEKAARIQRRIVVAAPQAAPDPNATDSAARDIPGLSAQELMELPEDAPPDGKKPPAPPAPPAPPPAPADGQSLGDLFVMASADEQRRYLETLTGEPLDQVLAVANPEMIAELLLGGDPEVAAAPVTGRRLPEVERIKPEAASFYENARKKRLEDELDESMTAAAKEGSPVEADFEEPEEDLEVEPPKPAPAAPPAASIPPSAGGASSERSAADIAAQLVQPMDVRQVAEERREYLRGVDPAKRKAEVLENIKDYPDNPDEQVAWVLASDPQTQAELGSSLSEEAKKKAKLYGVDLEPPTPATPAPASKPAPAAAPAPAAQKAKPARGRVDDVFAGTGDWLADMQANKPQVLRMFMNPRYEPPASPYAPYYSDYAKYQLWRVDPLQFQAEQEQLEAQGKSDAELRLHAMDFARREVSFWLSKWAPEVLGVDDPNVPQQQRTQASALLEAKRIEMREKSDALAKQKLQLDAEERARRAEQEQQERAAAEAAEVARLEAEAAAKQKATEEAALKEEDFGAAEEEIDIEGLELPTVDDQGRPIPVKKKKNDEEE